MTEYNCLCVVQSLNHVRLLATPWTTACQAPLSSMSPGVCSNSCPLSQWYYFFLCCPLLLPSIFPSIRVFPMSPLFASGRQKYWSFNFSVSLSNEHSGWIFFRIDWFDFLVVQRTLKSLLQHHCSRASILWHSAFFIGEGDGNPLQYSCLENPMDRGAWQATIHGVTKSWARLSD